MSTIGNTIERVVVDYGYSTYASQARRAADHLPTDRDITAYDVRRAASQAGVYQAVPGHLVDRVVSEVNRERSNRTSAGTAEVEAGQPTEGFNREAAAESLRQFAQSKGANPGEVEQALIDAGLVDEPPAPEENTSDEAPSWARSLIEKVDGLANFARQHGFRG